MENVEVALIEDALHEINKGIWDGVERVKLLEFEPGVLERAKHQGVDFHLHGGESPRQVGIRGVQWTDDEVLRCKQRSRSVLAISHTMAINCLVWARFGKDEEFALNPNIKKTSITHLRHDQGEWSLVALNDHAHLT